MAKYKTKPSAMLLDFLALSHWDSLQDDTPADEVTDVSRDELLNSSHGTIQRTDERDAAFIRYRLL